MKNLFAALGLLLVSGVAGLTLCEGYLRIFYPKYRDLVEASLRRDAIRIWARTPNSRDWMGHPDTRVTHTFHHNNLALRQHRDFSEADLASATNIGVFGDSFVENILMAVQYSFTEPLDYLLNQRGKRFNVLNFGVHGYGPGQSFLHYENFRHAEQLDFVLFVYCSNDLQELYETGLFHLDNDGHLLRHEAIRSSWWVPLISRLHISYLILDVRGRLSSYLTANASLRRTLDEERFRRIWEWRRAFLRRGRSDREYLKDSLEVFRVLLRHWKHVVEQNGGVFYFVNFTIDPVNFPSLSSLLREEDIEVIDLEACFEDADPAHTPREWIQSPYRFKNDLHWNEAGNRLAAVCLYRVLEEKMRFPPLSEGKLQDTLFQYYTAFEGEIPLKAKAEGRRSRPSEEASAAIREKYLALDISRPLKDFQEEIIEMVAQPDKRIIASDFNVYLDRNTLFYVKEECRPVDTQARFFLHVVPVDEKDLSERRRKHGFENEDFSQTGLDIGDQRCVVRKRLPAYPIRRIRTGQFARDTQGNNRNLWAGEFSTDQDAGARVEEGGG